MDALAQALEQTRQDALPTPAELEERSTLRAAQQAVNQAVDAITLAFTACQQAEATGKARKLESVLGTLGDIASTPFTRTPVKPTGKQPHTILSRVNPCGRCGAEAGKVCHYPSGFRYAHGHAERVGTTA